MTQMKLHAGLASALVLSTVAVASLLSAACAPPACAPASDPKHVATLDGADAGTASADGLPLCVVVDVALPGNSSRFDYQDIDSQNGHLIVAHMGDSEVLVINLADGAVAKRVPNIPTVRGVLAAPAVNRIFASASASDELVIVDATTLEETNRVSTGAGPDGLAFDAVDHIVAVSAQHAGAVSLIAHDGDGARTDVAVGNDTGNIEFDATRGHFFVTVTGPDQLVELTPAGDVVARIDVGGCSGAHGLRIHPNGKSALIACENNATAARVDLDGVDHAVVTAGTGIGPDVLSIDPGFGWLYLAAESGDLKIFDITGAGLKEIDSEHVGDNAHSVAVDAATHRAFFPLTNGGDGAPVLRIMAPTTK